jgi:hypothetical protein
MTTEFTDIKITGLLKERSYNVQGDIFRMYLKLSSNPSGGWIHIFESVWSQAFYSMKRRAGVESDAIWIDCVPEEMQQHHLERLKEAVAETNNHYKAWLKQQEQSKKAQEDLDRRNRKRLADLDDGLKFD